jgi:hypothetical protein
MASDAVRKKYLTKSNFEDCRFARLLPSLAIRPFFGSRVNAAASTHAATKYRQRNEPFTTGWSSVFASQQYSMPMSHLGQKQRSSPGRPSSGVPSIADVAAVSA